MKALTWHGKHDIRCESVPDPKIQDRRDAIIKVTACAICGSDLHIYDGMIPSMQSGDILGHETMGEVVEVGSAIANLKAGDRVVVPFTIACGECFFCRNGFFSGCERTNPDRKTAEQMWGHSPAGLFGFSSCSVATLAGRPNICASPMPTSAQSKFQTASPTNRSCFSPTFFRPDTWPPSLQHQVWRHDRDLGLRAGRAVCHSQRFPARRGSCDRNRHGFRAARARAGGRR